MDTPSYVALSQALDFSLPSALEDAIRQVEAARMEREDLAAHALQGRVTCNPGMSGRNCTWDDLARHWYGELHDARERARLALQRIEAISPAGWSALTEEALELLDMDVSVDLDAFDDMSVSDEDMPESP